MILALCNEMLADEGRSLAEQARIAAALGYQGLEIAPATLGPEPDRLPAGAIREARAQVEGEGLRVTGLHWLLAPYPDLSVTDPARRAQTQDVLRGLVDLCAGLGGDVLVHGSPAQRRPAAGELPEAARARLADFFRPVAAHAAERGVTYCLEPLSRAETPVVNTVAEARAVAEAVGSPAFATMIDTSAAGQTEPPVATLIRAEIPRGGIAHVHVNETARGAPGTGEDPWGEIVAALKAVGWDRTIAVEPFRLLLDASTTAAVGAATIRALWRAR